VRWGRQSAYSQDDGFVFASEKIGWRTFRHTFGTLLKANGEDVKAVQEILRHANSRIMLEV
jgi:integrase